MPRPRILSLLVTGILAFGLVFTGILSEGLLATGTRAAEKNSIPEAVSRGVRILLDCQENLEGKGPAVEWPYEGVYRVKGRIPIGYRIGGTSICGTALLEAPGFDEDSERREAVERALAFVLRSLRDRRMGPGFEIGYDVRGWGQAYALSFLSRLRELECVPTSRAREVDRAIARLIDLLEKGEIPSGGWNYSRRRGSGGRIPASTFMTASTLQALFAAAAQGEKVDERVVERALGALEEARLDTGAFQYAANPERVSGKGFEAVPGAVGRMPICETTLFLAGRGSVDRIRASLDAFFEHWEWLEKRRRQQGTHVPPYMIAPYYFFYAHAYVAQAIEMLPEPEREAYRERLRERIFRVREESGGWNDRVFDRSENFGTAMILLALRMPHTRPPAGWKPPDGDERRRDL